MTTHVLKNFQSHPTCKRRTSCGCCHSRLKSLQTTFYSYLNLKLSFCIRQDDLPITLIFPQMRSLLLRILIFFYTCESNDKWYCYLLVIQRLIKFTFVQPLLTSDFGNQHQRTTSSMILLNHSFVWRSISPALVFQHWTQLLISQ
ncbi:hypothetical protein Plhal304r1_c008g0033261 [Plasmopara halstedii]